MTGPEEIAAGLLWDEKTVLMGESTDLSDYGYISVIARLISKKLLNHGTSQVDGKLMGYISDSSLGLAVKAVIKKEKEDGRD